MAQTKLGEFTTYVFPDEFNRDSLVSAIRYGSTIAAFNLKIFSLNIRPSIEPVTVSGGGFEIKGTVGLIKYFSFKPSINVYKDGIEYVPPVQVTFNRTEKKQEKYSLYDFYFTDKLALGVSACYVLEVPHYMISSPFCFTATNK